MRLTGAFLMFACLGMTAVAAEPPAATTDTPATTEIPWYRRVFLGERSKPVPPKPATVAKPAPPLSPEAIEMMLKKEQEVYVTRLAAISKLRELANAQNDEAMMSKADQLEKATQELYDQRRTALQDTIAADRAALEAKPDERPATAERPGARRRPLPGGN
ncbi:hypothetical protein [Zavarzinella formosa]|uniref:hypothetical protein n=1 Tax=Zavarzinella formosa TaxID=360055 RepID=UPI0002D7266B|nr:hypothetical protein [Zavarzinella formosa]